MVKSRGKLSIKYVGGLLLKRNFITEEQHRELQLHGEAQRARLKKARDSASKSKISHLDDSISAPEVIASYEIEIPGKKGKTLTEDTITEVIADEVGLSYLKIDPLELDMDTVTSHISQPFARRHLVVPVTEKRGVVTVAVADPFELESVEELQRAKKLKLNIVMSSKSDIVKILKEFYGFSSSVIAAQKERTEGFDIGNLEQFVQLKSHSEIDASDQHIVNAVEYLMQYAFDQRASDIHIEPKREKTNVRLRIDGVLHEIYSIPKAIHPPIISRIKMLSRMDIAEKRRPQDGRIKTNYKDKDIELRVSTMPVAFGEKVVIRIFDPDVLLQDLEELGFYPREFEFFKSFINKPNGIILVTGPTGSGKTTTLYSALNALASPDINIITVEDPIEMVMDQFNQVGLQTAIGVTFGNALRTILRQDPDIIMVGEIRDKEAAENAVQAALTGHLVLSTLHTNDAPSSITRLIDLGIPSFLISSTVIGVIAQRLVRRICHECKRERELTHEERAHLELSGKDITVYFGEGCKDCRGTGYRGRDGVFEVMEISESVKEVMTDKVSLAALKEVVKSDGILTVRECAVRKMLEGVTTYEEVVRITG
ncbi:MAG: GspE/PulE family protein [Deltaproteobacteria bacterium]|nr:GspE/PulE family protein [Deltaproteobacteria bacterium]